MMYGKNVLVRVAHRTESFDTPNRNIEPNIVPKNIENSMSMQIPRGRPTSCKHSLSDPISHYHITAYTVALAY